MAAEKMGHYQASLTGSSTREEFMSEIRYDIKTADRIYPNLPAPIIKKYIDNNRFLSGDSISDAGQNNWQELIEHPEFSAIFADSLAADMEFEVQLPRQETQLVSSEKIGLMISQGTLKEAHRVRLPGEEEWQLAGDIEALQQHFSFRWGQQSQQGGAAKSRTIVVGTPFYKDFGAVFTFFKHRSFYYNFAAILICRMIFDLPLISVFGILITLWIYSYGFHLLYKVGDGATTFPERGHSTDILARLLRPMISMMLAQLIGILPLILILRNLPEVAMVVLMPFSVLFFRALDPLVWLGLFIFSLYLPMALTRMAAYNELMPPINLIALIRSVKRAWTPYIILVGIAVALDLSVVILGLIINLLMAAIAETPVGYLASFVGYYLAISLNIIGYFTKMFLMGRFLYQNRTRMGWS
jgi:hypothetical protein